MKAKTILATIALAIIVTFAQAGSEKKDLVTIAVGNKNFSTLVTAVKAAGLVEVNGARRI